MEDITRYQKQRIRKSVFKDFSQENGFKFVKSRILLKENDNVLNYLTFNSSNNHLFCDIVSQPLYIPATEYILTISNRLDSLRPPIQRIIRFPWGECNGNKEEYEKDVEEILDIFSKEGMDWFTHFDSSQKIIDTICNDNPLKYTIAFNITAQKRVQGLSYLYLRDLDNAVNALMEAQMTLREGHPLIEKYQKWIDFIRLYPEKIPSEIEKTIANTRYALGLTKPNV